MRKLPKTRSKVPSQTSGPWITESNGNDVVVGKINEISSEISVFRKNPPHFYFHGSSSTFPTTAPSTSSYTGGSSVEKFNSQRFVQKQPKKKRNKTTGYKEASPSQ
jgi:hypothetical protein